MMHKMLATFFHVSNNTQMLGIKYAYLMKNKIDEHSFDFKKIKN